MRRDAMKINALRDPDEAVLQAEVDRARYPLTKKAGNVNDLRNILKDVMWDDVVRCAPKTV